MVHPITSKLFFVSVPFPQSFQGRLPRWACVTRPSGKAGQGVCGGRAQPRMGGGRVVPVGVEHAAVRSSGDQAGGGGRGRGARPGREGSLEEGVCVHGADGDLLQTVGLC